MSSALTLIFRCLDMTFCSDVHFESGEGLDPLEITIRIYANISTSTPLPHRINRHLCTLLPCRVNTEQRTEGTCQTNKSFVKVRPAKRGGWYADIGKIGGKLQGGCIPFPVLSVSRHSLELARYNFWRRKHTSQSSCLQRPSRGHSCSMLASAVLAGRGCRSRRQR
jgi:hypothetical protein